MPKGVYTRRRVPVESRFWSKIDRNGPIPDYAPHLGPCWLWTASTSPFGYGQFFPSHGVRVTAHVMVYELLIGPKPEGLQLDHLCRVPRCVNPGHLEPVTCRENLLRGQTITARAAAATHCPAGHPYDAENTHITTRGHRICRECRRRRQSEFETRQRRYGPNRKK